jgi:hypothetical protein
MGLPGGAKYRVKKARAARRPTIFGPGSQVSQTRHCKHCWGDCLGSCLLPGDEGLCIHVSPYRGLPLREWPRLMRTRRFWRWFLVRR